MNSVRTIAPIKCEPIDIRRPFSNFEFCENNFNNSLPLKRILSQLRIQQASTMIQEEIPLPDELLEENEALKLRTDNDFLSAKAFRLSFFKKVIKKSELAKVEQLNDEDFLGYAILTENSFKNPSKYSFAKNIVFESVIKPCSHRNNFIHVTNTFEAKILNKKFKIIGTLFCQQNRLTSVCAHSALRTVLSSMMYNYSLHSNEINKILHIDHKKDKLGENGKKKGLNPDEIREVILKKGLKDFGFIYTSKDSVIKKSSKKYPFQKYLYASIESCFGGLLGFSSPTLGANHLVPVIGHTFNQDAWLPAAERSYFQLGKMRYLSSEFWASSFIIHDDNFGSYYCLPLRFFSTYANLRCWIGIMPKNIHSDPVEIEPRAVKFADKIIDDLTRRIEVPNDLIWLKRFIEWGENRSLVVRTHLMNKETYLKDLKTVSDWEKRKIERNIISDLERILPGSFWITEISLPELFPANKRKLGEIILRSNLEFDPTIRHLDMNFFVAAKLPGCVVIWDKTNFRYFLQNHKSHTPLYRC